MWLYCILMLGTDAVFSTELTSQFTGNLLLQFTVFGYYKIYFKSLSFVIKYGGQNKF